MKLWWRENKTEKTYETNKKQEIIGLYEILLIGKETKQKQTKKKQKKYNFGWVIFDYIFKTNSIVKNHRTILNENKRRTQYKRIFEC